VVLAKKEGIIFIPAHLAEQVVTQSEALLVKDAFGHQRLREGKYTPGQIDARWSAEIRADFEAWLKENGSKLPFSKEVLDQVLNSSSRNW
jgi:hypothetical protein